jgi:hypothetical protein
MHASRLITLVCAAVLFLSLGVAALSPFTARTRVTMPDGSTISVFEGSCLIPDDRMAFTLLGVSGVFSVAAALYRFIPRRSST